MSTKPDISIQEKHPNSVTFLVENYNDDAIYVRCFFRFSEDEGVAERTCAIPSKSGSRRVSGWDEEEQAPGTWTPTLSGTYSTDEGDLPLERGATYTYNAMNVDTGEYAGAKDVTLPWLEEPTISHIRVDGLTVTFTLNSNDSNAETYEIKCNRLY